MSCFARLLHNCKEYNTIRTNIEKNKLPMGVIGLPPAPKAHLIHSLCADIGRKAFVVMPDEAAAVKLCADLVTMGTNAVLYPARDFRFHSAESVSRELEQKRIGALSSLLNNECEVLVFSAEAAVQRTVPPEELKKRSAGCEVVMIANNPYPAEVVNACDSLKMLNVAFTGIDHVDKCRRVNVSATDKCNLLRHKKYLSVDKMIA